MTVFVALLLQAAPALASPPKDVVVTGQRLETTAKALADCLARHCPPREDIDASLAHGENLFLAGEYAQARHVLARARGRNLRYAATFPVEVADLARAYGRLSTFDGFADVGRISQIDSLDALKAGLDHGDARVLMQRMLVGDEFVRQGRLIAGEEIYKTVEQQAAAAKLPNVQGFAMLRRAVVYGALASFDRTYEQAARHRMKRIEETTDPVLAPFRDAVGLLRAQLAALDGDGAALEHAIAALGARGVSRPVLVYNPPIEIDVRPISGSRVVDEKGDSSPQWIDLMFEIGRDGRVGEIEVLRRSETVGGDWPDRVREAVAKRRYAPLAADVSPSLLQRAERFSLVFDVRTTASSRSRIRARSPRGHIVSLDLTPDPELAPMSNS